jgi:hypothetical protein
LRILVLLALIVSPCIAEDIYFEIHFQKLGKLMEKMLEIKDLNPYCKIFIYKGKHKVNVFPDDENDIINKLLTKTCEDKLKLVKPYSIDEYLDNYDFSESKSDWKIYVDKTGVSEVNEIWVKENKKAKEIIEKRSIGTSRYEYGYKGDLITKVSSKVYEGLQSITSEHKIDYNKISNKNLPVKVESKYIQKLSKRDIGDFERKFDEVVYLKNYKVDQNVALKYFSQSN